MQHIGQEQARAFMKVRKPGDYTLLDVRQKWEYEEFHLSGAHWIPLPELSGRAGELDRARPVLAYCRSGARSAAAAGLLDGMGFPESFSLAGGISAWQGAVGFGPLETGLEHFMDVSDRTDMLLLAYGMEDCLHHHYKDLEAEAQSAEAREIWGRLASFEDKHRSVLYGRYKSLADQPMDETAFREQAVQGIAEGGVEPEEFLADVGKLMTSPQDAVDLAMMVEGQALDYYMRCSRRAGDPDLRTLLESLAAEEQAHLRVLAEFLRQIA